MIYFVELAFTFTLAFILVKTFVKIRKFVIHIFTAERVSNWGCGRLGKALIVILTPNRFLRNVGESIELSSGFSI